jgi:hypothetical protein
VDLLTVILVLATVFVVSWAVNNYVPMDAGIQSLLNFTVAIFMVIWLLLNVFGVTFPYIALA